MHRTTKNAAAPRGIAALLSIVLTLLLAAPQASATPIAIPWRAGEVSFTARERPLRDFLQEFFAGQGLSVVVSSGVRGTVNGNFSGRPEQIFDDMIKAFSLLPYYDGTLVHVNSAGEAETRTISVPASMVPRLMGTMRELKMLNTRHTARAVPAEGIVVLSGSPRFVEQGEDIARNLSRSARAGDTGGGSGGGNGGSRNGRAYIFKMFPLKYAWAQDVTLNYGGKEVMVPGVASVLRSLLGSPSGGTAYFDAPDRTLRPTVEKLRGRGMASIGEDRRRRGGRNSDQRNSDQYEDEYYDEPPPAPVPVNANDQVRIEAERRLNAVIVRDTKDRMAYYEQLIAALDVEPQLVEISASIVDVNTDKAQQLGVNYRFSNAGDEALFGRGDQSDLRLRRGQDITPAGEGFFFSTVLGNSGNFVARVNALATEDAAKVISRPQIVTMSNTEAIVEANRSFFVRIAGDYDVDLFNVNAGTTLRVTPHVLKEPGQVPRIRLLVTVEDGTLTNAQVDQIPIVDRAAINTQALILEGESLLLGGLVRDEEFKSVRKVPLLGDVPVVKYLFRYSTKNKTRVERLFLITPRLIPANRIVQPATPGGAAMIVPPPGGSNGAVPAPSYAPPAQQPYPPPQQTYPSSLPQQTSPAPQSYPPPAANPPAVVRGGRNR